MRFPGPDVVFFDLNIKMLHNFIFCIVEAETFC